MEGHVIRSRGIALLFALGCSASRPQFQREPERVIESRDLGTLHTSGAPPLDRAIDDALDPYAAITQARLLDIASDGGDVLAFLAGQVVELRVDGSAAPRISDLDVEWATFAESGTIIALADRDGDEDTRLYRRTEAGIALLVENHGRMTDPIARHGRIAWAEPTADGAKTTLWVRDRAGTVRSAFIADGAWVPLDISLDGKQLLARRVVSLRSSAIYRIDVDGGAPVPLTSFDVATPAAQWGPGVVYAISDASSDRLGLWEISTQDKHLVSKGAWEVTQLAVAPDASVVAFVTNEDGASVLHVYDPVNHTERAVPAAPTGGVITDLRYADAAPVLAFSFTDWAHPRNAFTYDLATNKLELRTRVNLGALAESKLVPLERAKIASFDGTLLPALVYRPALAHMNAVVVELHGGPEDQWLPKWSAFEQFLASRGIAVVMPNVRGSTGYGKAFAALDDGDHREDAVRDVGAVLDWIGTQSDLGSNISVMGTSYGGYLALASLIAYPDRLRAGIDMVGITDFVSFLGNTRGDRRDQRRTEYGDERVLDTRRRLSRISPIAHASAIRAPLLVAQGRKDPRVPAGDADRFVRAVRLAGGIVWYLVADDEGHGFASSANRGAFEVLATQLLETTASKTSPK